MIIVSDSQKGFTLLEVVLSVAIFTVVVAPILGMLALTAQSGNESSNVVRAEELKRLVVNELHASIKDAGGLSWGFNVTNVGIFANEDLSQSALFTGTLGNQFKYFSVDVQDPVDVVASANDITRMVLLDIRWPAYVQTRGVWVNNLNNEIGLKQMIVPVVLTKP